MNRVNVKCAIFVVHWMSRASSKFISHERRKQDTHSLRDLTDQWVAIHLLPHAIFFLSYQLFEVRYDNHKYTELEYWQSQEGPRRALCKFAGAMFNLYKSRSKFTVKVTFKIFGYHWKGMDIRNIYEHPVSYSNKVMANVQKYVKGHRQGHILLEYWQSQEGPSRALCKFAGQW